MRNVIIDQFGRVRGRCWYPITVPEGWTIKELEEHWSVPINTDFAIDVDVIAQWRKRAKWWASLPEMAA